MLAGVVPTAAATVHQRRQGPPLVPPSPPLVPPLVVALEVAVAAATVATVAAAPPEAAAVLGAHMPAVPAALSPEAGAAVVGRY